ncbi:MAG: cyclase family protein [Clostridia bacterium]|nr:cyclase family protein [Clostridia bacterium]
MKIYDISQEVFSCCVYPGDPTPSRGTVLSTDKGDVCNLTEFSMCAHNGTHIDAPFHFLGCGDTVDKIPLEKTFGFAYVAHGDGEAGVKEITEIIEKAKTANVESAKRILVGGKITLTLEGAKALNSAGVVLFGNESQSVGPEDAPMAVHLELLGTGVVLLEGIRLSHVPEGVYLLSAVPINLGGCDGAPCRAVLSEI